MSMTRRWVLLGLACLAAFMTAHAQSPDAAVAQVRTLSAALLKSMKAGKAQSMTERYQSLESVIEQTFALPLMTRLAVGPDWDKFSPEQQQASIAAFRRYTIANYAYNFREFDGQRFDVEDSTQSRGQDTIVQTHIVSTTHGTSTSLMYRMREVEGAWKILDVYADGVSMLSMRRTDFVAVVSAGGAPALIAFLQKNASDLMK
jgi:phospholipid transport system substrate-binding protein